MRTRLFAFLCFAACAEPCPETAAFCMQIDAGSCVVWPATCCYGLQACKRDSTPVADAGSCTLIAQPPSEMISCQ
jgi:hypothetical protein